MIPFLGGCESVTVPSSNHAYELRGTVRSARTGLGIAGATVVLELPTDFLTRGTLQLGVATTDAEGHYTLHARGPESYDEDICAEFRAGASASGYALADFFGSATVPIRCTSSPQTISLDLLPMVTEMHVTPERATVHLGEALALQLTTVYADGPGPVPDDRELWRSVSIHGQLGAGFVPAACGRVEAGSTRGLGTYLTPSELPPTLCGSNPGEVALQFRLRDDRWFLYEAVATVVVTIVP
jgi:hypothetical protein